MKRERLFYLDFVRAAATLIIVLTHFNAWYLYTSPAMPEKAVFSLWFGNIYIGEVGVSLFLILSGAALMYVYENHLNIKQFYKKRFLNIYPLFWLVYLAAFLFEFYRNQGINTFVPKYRIIYSLLGMDTYSLVLGGPPNFAIVGEWFLGMIIFFYLLFPLLRKWMLVHPISLYITVNTVYVLCIFINRDGEVLPKTLPMLLPRVLFGMCFVKYKWKIKLPVALISVIIIAFNGRLPIKIDMSLQSTYIGIALFCILVYAAGWLRRVTAVKNMCAVICRYSYAIFICHHIIINYMVMAFDLNTISRFNSYLLFLCCCCAIFIAAVVFQKIHDCIMNRIFIVQKS